MPSIAEIVHSLELRGIRLSLANGLGCRDPNGALDEADRRLIASRRAEIIAHLAIHAASRKRPRIPTQPCAPRPSFFQEVWWKIAAANPGRSDVIPLVVPYRAADGAVAEAAARAIVARHDALRYTFALSEGRLAATLNDAGTFRVEHAQLEQWDEAGSLDAAIRAFATRVMPASAAWLVQAKVLHGPPGSGLLMLLVHHMVGDGTSMRILRDELAALLQSPAGGRADLQPATQFSSYAAWERSWFAGEYARALASYWSGWIESVPRLAAPRGGRQLQWVPGRRIVHPFTLGRLATARLRAQSTQLGSGTPLYLLLAITSMAIGEWAGQDRFAMLVTADGRAAVQTLELLSAVGLIMHTDAVEVSMHRDETLRPLIKRLLVHHQSARALHFPPNRDHAGLREEDFHHRIGVVVNYLPAGAPAGDMDAGSALEQGSELQAYTPVGRDAGYCASPMHPIYVRLSLGENGFVGSLEFNDGAIDTQSQVAMVRLFLGKLGEVLADA